MKILGKDVPNKQCFQCYEMLETNVFLEKKIGRRIIFIQDLLFSWDPRKRPDWLLSLRAIFFSPLWLVLFTLARTIQILYTTKGNWVPQVTLHIQIYEAAALGLPDISIPISSIPSLSVSVRFLPLLFFLGGGMLYDRRYSPETLWNPSTWILKTIATVMLCSMPVFGDNVSYRKQAP